MISITSAFTLAISAAASVAALDSGAQPGQFKILGDTGVSAQMMMALPDERVVIIDKTENNPLQINGHPAWATTYDLTTNTATAMDVTTNTFCACGAALPDGTMVLIGGNNAVAPGGVTVNDTTGNPYQDANGGEVIRLFDYRTNAWDESFRLSGGARWYPTVEPLSDGSVIIIGGCRLGAYINAAYQDNPTIEYYPARPSNVTASPFLAATMPANLYAITYLLPSGLLFMQAAYSTILYNMDTNVETPLPDMKHALRLYPWNAAVTALPLTPANNYTLTVLFCGGVNLTMEQIGNDTGPMFPITQYPADKTCVRISPDGPNPQYDDDEDMLEGRVMGNFISLPDGKFLVINGIATGTAGYSSVGYGDALPRSNEPNWVVGESFGDNPILQPAIYDPSAPMGSRWSRNNLGTSEIPRLYHSTATLLTDGSVLLAGSNPNADVSNVKWGTEYRAEKFYPSYYNEARPAPQGLPSNISYGGDAFQLTLSKTDLRNNMQSIKNTTVMIMKPGFSTHALNFGGRTLQLETSYDGSGEDAILHVSQLPPNANLFTPGPAMLFVVVNGVPSIGHWVNVGNGVLGVQPVSAQTQLPSNIEPTSGSGTNGTSGNGSNNGSSAGKLSGLSVATLSSITLLIIGTACI